MRWQPARLFRLLVHEVATPYPQDGTTEEQRLGMQMLWWDNILAAMSIAFVTDFETLYLLTLGASPGTIGARASIVAAAGLLAPLVGAWLVAMSGKRKIWVLLNGGGLARVALALSALAPVLFFRPEAAVTFVVAMAAIRSFTGSVTLPPFNSLFGDLVPPHIRGRMMGLRMMAASAVTVLMLPIAGNLIKAIGGVEGYQVTLGIATVIGFVSTYFYSRIPEIKGEESARLPAGAFSESFRAVRHDRGFLFFCGINIVWTLGIQISAPFFSVHMVEDLGFGVDIIALLTTVVTIFNILAVRLAGTLVDRKGAEPMTRIGMLLVPLMPLAWMLARTPLEVGVARIYGVFAWAGVQVAATPLILQIAPRQYTSQYVAVFNTLNGISAMLGPLLAAQIYAVHGFNTNLALSAAVRGLGAVLFLWASLRGLFSRKQAAAPTPVATP